MVQGGTYRLKLHVRAAMRRYGTGRVAAVLAAIPILSVTLVLAGCYTFRDRTPDIVERDVEPAPKVQYDRMVRVRLLGRRAQKSVQLAVSSRFKIKSFTQRDEILAQRAQALATCDAVATADGGLLFGDLAVPAGDILIHPERDAAITVNGKTYRGLLRVLVDEGKLTVTNHVDLESYLKGVLRGELPRHFHPESFKAQCVAARTYVLYQMRIAPKDRSFDVYDNEGSQMYIGVLGEGDKALAAVEQTAGEVCVYPSDRGDVLFCTYYSSACGGRSQHVNNVKPNDPDPPPLAGGVVCNDCYLARFYEWDPVRISKAELTERIVKRYPTVKSIGTIRSLRPKEIEDGGHIVRIQMNGANGTNETLIGEDFRLSVGGRTLKSTNFKIREEDDAFVFEEGRGFGHGIGLCQNGMETKALRGQDYKAILRTYYPGCEVVRIY